MLHVSGVTVAATSFHRPDAIHQRLQSSYIRVAGGGKGQTWVGFPSRPVLLAHSSEHAVVAMPVTTYCRVASRFVVRCTCLSCVSSLLSHELQINIAKHATKKWQYTRTAAADALELFKMAAYALSPVVHASSMQALRDTYPLVHAYVSGFDPALWARSLKNSACFGKLTSSGALDVMQIPHCLHRSQAVMNQPCL